MFYPFLFVCFLISACPSGYFGNCKQTCHCALGPTVCLKDTGECQTGGCLPGWAGVNCQGE